MRLLNINPDDEEILREYRKLSAKASFTPSESVLLPVILFLPGVIAAVWFYLVTGEVFGSVAIGFGSYLVGPAWLVSFLLFALVASVGLSDLIDNAHARRQRRKAWYQRYELLKTEVERIESANRNTSDAIKSAESTIDESVLVQQNRRMLEPVRPSVPKESNSIPESRAKRSKTTNPKLQANRLIEVSSQRPVIKVPTREEIKLPKRSAEDWERISRDRRNVGASGEFLVLEFERNRVANSEGAGALHRVRHVSAESDALGYDIVSVLEGIEVFIEVKTTRGKFWTDFFITKNEFEAMRKYKERYWVYRVHGLDTKTGQGLISVFRGIDEIENYFYFEPSIYAFRPRDSEE